MAASKKKYGVEDQKAMSDAAAKKKQYAGLVAAGDYFSGKGVRGGERAQAAASAKRIQNVKRAIGQKENRPDVGMGAKRAAAPAKAPVPAKKAAAPTYGTGRGGARKTQAATTPVKKKASAPAANPMKKAAPMPTYGTGRGGARSTQSRASSRRTR